MKKKGKKKTNDSTKDTKKKVLISNLIPFTTLNVIFAFSCVVSTVVRLIQNTQVGVPNLSVQLSTMILCLLFANSEVNQAIKKRFGFLKKNTVAPEISMDRSQQHAQQPLSMEQGHSHNERHIASLTIEDERNKQERGPQHCLRANTKLSDEGKTIFNLPNTVPNHE